MLCAECENVLSDYIDGDVGLAVRREVEAHLAACARCDGLHDDLARIIQASASLPLHTPPSYLWGRIEREIASRPATVPFLSRRFNFTVSARQIAAAAALAISASVIGVYALRQEVAPTAMGAGWGGMTTTPIQAQPLVDLHRLEDLVALRASIADMERSVLARRASWTPELRGAFERGVSELDTRIVSLTEECGRTPEDADCRKRLVGALREKLALLEGYAGIGAEAHN